MHRCTASCPVSVEGSLGENPICTARVWVYPAEDHAITCMETGFEPHIHLTFNLRVADKWVKSSYKSIPRNPSMDKGWTVNPWLTGIVTQARSQIWEYSLVVKPQSPKLHSGVRFPVLSPKFPPLADEVIAGAWRAHEPGSIPGDRASLVESFIITIRYNDRADLFIFA